MPAETFTTSIAGLPSRSAAVGVGPPLFAGRADEQWLHDFGTARRAAGGAGEQVPIEQSHGAGAVTGRRAVRAQVVAHDRVAHVEGAAQALRPRRTTWTTSW